jgi:hypothetical protein
LTVDGQEFSQPLRVDADPSSSITILATDQEGTQE